MATSLPVQLELPFVRPDFFVTMEKVNVSKFSRDLYAAREVIGNVYDIIKACDNKSLDDIACSLNEINTVITDYYNAELYSDLEDFDYYNA